MYDKIGIQYVFLHDKTDKSAVLSSLYDKLSVLCFSKSSNIIIAPAI